VVIVLYIMSEISIKRLNMTDIENHIILSKGQHVVPSEKIIAVLPPASETLYHKLKGRQTSRIKVDIMTIKSMIEVRLVFLKCWPK